MIILLIIKQRNYYFITQHSIKNETSAVWNEFVLKIQMDRGRDASRIVFRGEGGFNIFTSTYFKSFYLIR